MKRTWIVIMDRTGARLFERREHSPSLTLLKEWEHPGGNFREGELTSDRPGIGRMNSREYRNNVLTPSGSAKEETLKRFCHEIADYLDTERTTKKFDELMLVAEPHTLGMLRATLPDQVERKIAAIVDKDFAWVETRKIAEVMSAYL